MTTDVALTPETRARDLQEFLWPAQTVEADQTIRLLIERLAANEVGQTHQAFADALYAFRRLIHAPFVMPIRVAQHHYGRTVRRKVAA